MSRLPKVITPAGGKGGMTRRTFVKVGATSLLAAPFVLRPRGARAADSIVIADDGGSFQELKREIFFRPFTADTGIEIIEVNNNTGHLDRLKAQVMTGNVEWDAVYLNGQAAYAADKEGLVEAIDYDLINVDNALHPQWVLPGALCYGSFASGLAYNPAAKHPRTFAVFWDVENFPGRRGLYQQATYTLEMALAADGVPPEQIYPIDFDRAFASLDRIKDHVNVWMTHVVQTINMIQTGEVDFDFSFQTRVFAARNEGISIDFVRDNSTISGASYIVIPRGSQKKDLVMQFLTYVNRPDLQAELANRFGMPPENGDAYPLVDQAMLDALPPPGHPNAIALDMGWWGENLVEAEERFTEWTLT